MAFITLDDRSGRLEVAIFSDTYNEYREKLTKDAMLVVVEGQVSRDDYSGGLKMRADSVMDLTDARKAKISGIHIDCSSQGLNEGWPRHLRSALSPYLLSNPEQTGCPITIRYHRSDCSAKVTLGKSWQVDPNDEVLGQLRIQFGHEQVSVRYRETLH